VLRLVTRYGACLGELPARQRRVLRLRAGIGRGDPASRATVARRLELPLTRVRQAERRGLRALRRFGRTGCGAASATDGADAGTGLGAAAPGGGPAAATSVLASGSGGAGAAGRGGGDPAGSDPAGGDPAGGGSGGGDGSRDDGGTGSADSGAVKGISAIGQPPRPNDSSVLVTLLGALLLVACLAGFGRETRRVWRSRTRY